MFEFHSEEGCIWGYGWQIDNAAVNQAPAERIPLLLSDHLCLVPNISLS